MVSAVTAWSYSAVAQSYEAVQTRLSLILSAQVEPVTTTVATMGMSVGSSSATPA